MAAYTNRRWGATRFGVLALLLLTVLRVRILGGPRMPPLPAPEV